MFLPLSLFLSILLTNAVANDVSTSVPEAPHGWKLLRGVDPYRIGDDRDARRMEAWIDAHEPAFIACFESALKDGYQAGTIMSLLLKPSLRGGVSSLRIKLSTNDRELDACVHDTLFTLHIDPAPQFRDVMRVNLRWAPQDPPPAPAAPVETPKIPQPAPVYTEGLPEDDGF